MHTAMVIAGGLVLLALMAGGGSLLGLSRRRAAIWFIPVWLVCALVNLTVGVMHAGYTVAQEAPILVVVFGVPAAIAAFVAWRSPSLS